MLPKRAFLSVLLALTLVFSTGCGGVKSGPATADDPEPKLTKEEIEGEKEVIRAERESQGDQ